MALLPEVIIIFCGCCGWALLFRYLHKLWKKKRQAKRKLKSKIS